MAEGAEALPPTAARARRGDPPPPPTPRPGVPPPRLPRLQGLGRRHLLLPRLPQPPPRPPWGAPRARLPPQLGGRGPSPLHPHHRLALLPRRPGLPLLARPRLPPRPRPLPLQGYGSWDWERTPPVGASHRHPAARTGARGVRGRGDARDRGRVLRRGWVPPPQLPRGPFRLVFVFSVKVDAAYVTSVLVYSSATGAWGEPTSMQGEFSMRFTHYSSVLVEKESPLLYFMSDDVLILEYDLARHNLAVLDTPEQYGYPGRFNILLAEDGGLGFCQYSYPKLKMWTREAAQWVPSRAIFLENLLPIGNLVDADTTVQVMGFAEEADVVFFNTNAGIFMVERQSRQARKVFDYHGYGFCNVIPVVSFYTPVPRAEPLLLGPSQEPGPEEGGEEEVDQADQLFDKRSNATKEGGLVNTFECVSHDVQIRDPCYGEVAPECASMEDKPGHALPSEAQEVTDPLGDVPNNPLNEELVKRTSTTSKDDDGNSKTSGSNVEDAAPTS